MTIKNTAGKVSALFIACAFLAMGVGFGLISGIMVSKPAPQSSDPYLLPPSRSQSDPASYSPKLDHRTLLAERALVTGRVVRIAMEVEDEETRFHFLILPDPAYFGMLNDGNKVKLEGALMIEILEADNFVAPKLHIGQHLEIQGPHVTDNNNGWNEINPASVIRSI